MNEFKGSSICKKQNRKLNELSKNEQEKPTKGKVVFFKQDTVDQMHKFLYLILFTQNLDNNNL